MMTADTTELQKLREELRKAQIRTLQEHARITNILAQLDALCAHDWISQGHVGPYEKRICRHCAATDFIS
jgi:hypothetical protein